MMVVETLLLATPCATTAGVVPSRTSSGVVSQWKLTSPRKCGRHLVASTATWTVGDLRHVLVRRRAEQEASRSIIIRGPITARLDPAPSDPRHGHSYSVERRLLLSSRPRDGPCGSTWPSGGRSRCPASSHTGSSAVLLGNSGRTLALSSSFHATGFVKRAWDRCWTNGRGVAWRRRSPFLDPEADDGSRGWSGRKI